MTSASERAALLRIARDAITAHVTGAGPPLGEALRLDDRRNGVFVTIHRRGDLRGCIGHIEGDDPLPRAVAQCAVAAGSVDPRFQPVTPAELPEIEIEISVLGPLEPVAGPAEIEVGRHGLVVELKGRRGLLLPQVATEWKWDATTFLSQTCRKAGLPADCWQRGAKVWRFEAEVFAD
jgi:AmmeMemoRadiSam system protein A